MSEPSLFQLPSPVQSLDDPWLRHQNIHVDIKRDDQIHPIISGNKLRKLIGHLDEIKTHPPAGIITMGGPWSNHIHATAYWANSLGLPCVVLIRGAEPERFNNLLFDLKSWGTILRFIDRITYRELRQAYETDTLDTVNCLDEFKDYRFIPEGGYHALAVTGIADLVAEIETDYQAVYIAVGTGTTLGGLAGAWPNSTTQLNGIQAVSADASQQQIIANLAGNRSSQVRLCSEYQFGGFAKVTESLIQFMTDIHQKTGLITEPVYTAKALYALYDHIKQGRYARGDKLLFIHTGGLQGLRGYEHPALKTLARLAGF